MSQNIRFLFGWSFWFRLLDGLGQPSGRDRKSEVWKPCLSLQLHCKCKFDYDILIVSSVSFILCLMHFLHWKARYERNQRYKKRKKAQEIERHLAEGPMNYLGGKSFLHPCVSCEWKKLTKPLSFRWLPAPETLILGY